MLCRSDDSNTMASSFYDLFLAVLDGHAPLKKWPLRRDMHMHHGFLQASRI